jgi:uncharacterized membrane protein
MATVTRRQGAGIDRVKYAFFALMGACVLLVLWVDERFWLNPADPHWKHVAPVKWLLAIHGLCGATALTAGASQMSSRIRKRRPALHRAVGKIYIAAVCISAPVAVYMGTSTLEPESIRVEQVFQGGLWLLSALVAWACIRSGQMAMHKAWMMRSYAFTLIFVTSRVPDAFFSSYSDQVLSDGLWSLVVIGAIAPEVILTGQNLWRIQSAKARARSGAPAAASQEQFAG